MFDLKTVNDVFGMMSTRGEKVAMLWQDVSTKDKNSEWKPITSAELYGKVRALAGVLQGWGVGKGDRVAGNHHGASFRHAIPHPHLPLQEATS